MSQSIFEFDWTESRGLDLNLIEWQARCGSNASSPIVLELGQALYSAFSELRKIRRIMTEGRPGVTHSFYQFRFELFSHNHFLSIATTRVVKIYQIGWPSAAAATLPSYAPLIKRVTDYRNSLEHQTEIGMQKFPPRFFNNLDDNGFVSEGIAVAYAEIESLLNAVMSDLESRADRPDA